MLPKAPRHKRSPCGRKAHSRLPLTACAGSLRAPINHIPLLAVGGVTPENLGAYLKAGMAGAGIGSALVKKEDVAADNFDAIAARAARYVAVVESI